MVINLKGYMIKKSSVILQLYIHIHYTLMGDMTNVNVNFLLIFVSAFDSLASTTVMVRRPVARLVSSPWIIIVLVFQLVLFVVVFVVIFCCGLLFK